MGVYFLFHLLTLLTIYYHYMFLVLMVIFKLIIQLIINLDSLNLSGDR